MNLDFIKSPKTQKVILIIGGMAMLLAVFSLGVEVGFHKAGFSRGYSDNYYRNFQGEGKKRGFPGEFGGRGMMGDLNDRGMMTGFSSAGEVLDINVSGLTVMDRDGIEKIVLVSDKTLIKQFRDTIKLTDLKTGDAVVVMGQPNAQGQIEAKLIRVMPVPGSIVNTPSLENIISSTTLARPATSTLASSTQQ